MTDKPLPHYSGPLKLEEARSLLALAELSDAAFTRAGPDAEVEHRDLGLAAATGGRIGATHTRALRPFSKETGWHWHDMNGHFVFVIRGFITFGYAGHEGDIVVRAGGCLSQPGGVPHNVIGHSDDLELIEINMPAEFGTWAVETGPAANHQPLG